MFNTTSGAKNYLKLLIPLFLIGCVSIPGFAQEVTSVGPYNMDLSDLSNITGNIGQVETELEQSIFAQANPNTGAFTTSLTVAVGANLLGWPGLNLKYSHQRTTNLGMGVGWEWDLPRIEKRSGLPNSPYVFINNKGTIELKESPAEKNTVRSLVITLTGLSNPILQLFRPTLDEGGTVYVYASEGEKSYWLSLSTDGTRWLFSGEGRPLRLYSRYLQFIEFTWTDGVLTQVEDSGRQWDLHLFYSSQKQLLPSFYLGEWAKLPQYLESVQLRSKVTGATKILRFTNDGEYLTSAQYEGAIQPLVRLTYSDFKPSIVGQRANDVVKNDRRVYVKDQTPEGKFIIPEDEVLYLDINGDQKSDKVIISSKHFSQKFHEIYDSSDTPEAKLARMNRYDLDIHVEIAVAENAQSPIQYLRDDSININNLLRANNLKLLNVTRPSQQFIARPIARINFVDVDGDKILDLVYLPLDNHLDQSQIQTDYSKWLYNQSKGDQRNKLIYAAKVFKPRIWIVQPDFIKIKSQWEEIKATSTPITTSNTLTGFFQLKEIDVGSLRINNYTNPIDLGGGIKGWYNKDHLQLISGVNPITDRLNLTTVEIPFHQLLKKGIFEGKDLLSNDAESSQLVNLGDGHLQVVSFLKVNSKLNTAILSFDQIGTSYDIQMGAPAKLMTMSQSSFGGKIEVKYKIASGIYAVDSITRKAISNPTTIESYDYDSLVFDTFRGTWTGFSKVKVTRQSSSNLVESKTTEHSFFNDLGPETLLYASRSSLTGRPMSLKIKGKQMNLKQTLFYDSPQLMETGDNRFFLLPTSTESRSFSENGDVYFNRQRTSSEIKTWIKSEDGILLMPETIETSVVGNGLRSPHSDSLIDGHKTDETHFKFYGENYLLNDTLVSTKDLNGHRSNPSTLNTYDASGIYLNSTCEERRCTSFDYDELGRPKKIMASNGAWMSFIYMPKSPLLVEVNDSESKIVYTWDDLLVKPKTIKNNLGLTLSYSYSPEGITKEIKSKSDDFLSRNNEAVLFSYNKFDQNTFRDRQLEVKVLDQSQVWRLDGFGRLQEKLIWRNNKWASTGFSEYNGSRLLRRWEEPPGKQGLSLIYTQRFNALDQPTEAWEQGHGKLTLQYDKNCTIKTLNDTKLTESCYTSLGNIVSQRVGNEIVNLDTLTDGTILGIPTYGINYTRSIYNELTENSSNGYGNSKPWRNDIREIDDQQLWEKSNDGLLIQRDSHGRMVKTSNTEGRPGVLEEEFSYQKGMIKSLNVKYGTNHVFEANNEYNAWGKVQLSKGSAAGQTFERRIEFDKYGRTIEDKFTTATSDFKMGLFYNQGYIEKIDPWILKIERDTRDNIIKVIYSNGSSLKREFEPGTNRLKSVTLINKENSLLYGEKYTFNNIGQITNRMIDGQLLKKVDRFTYDNGNYQSSNGPLANQLRATRDQKGQVYNLDGRYFSYSNGNLVGADYVDIYNTADGEGRVFCPKGGSISHPITKKCTFKVSSDEFIVNGIYIRRIMVDGLTLGFWLNDEFFPAIVDHLGSVKAVTHPSGLKLFFAREYGEWGEKKVHYADKNIIPQQQSQALDLYIVWAYSGLHTAPIFELKRQVGDPELYWSATRVYSPQIKEWLTVDPAVKWIPSVVVQNPGNWHATRYAANDPVNKIDPKGYIAAEVALAPGVIGGFIGGAVGFYTEYNSPTSTPSTIAFSTISSASSGAVTAYTGVVGGMAVGAMSSFANQYYKNGPENISIYEITKYAFLGGVSGYFGNLGTKFLYTSQKVVGKSLAENALPNLTNKTMGTYVSNLFATVGSMFLMSNEVGTSNAYEYSTSFKRDTESNIYRDKPDDVYQHRRNYDKTKDPTIDDRTMPAMTNPFAI